MPVTAGSIRGAVLFGVSGPGTAVNIPLKPGSSVTIGRAEPAQVAIESDNFLSRVHFEVACSADSVTLRDMGSRNGVFFRGLRVQSCDLAEGDRFTAGASEYGVRIEHSAANPVATLLSGLGEPLYAVLDAARDDSVLDLLRMEATPYVSLYYGQSVTELATVAPYLVQLPAEGKVLEQLTAQGWGKAWGIFLTSSSPMEEIWRQFRRSLMVQVNGTQMYFRFYDPRVLRVFLSVADHAQWREFSGGIRSVLMESEDGEALLRFRSDGYKVVMDQVSVSASAPAPVSVSEPAAEADSSTDPRVTPSSSAAAR